MTSRILIVDDTPFIHDDFNTILAAEHCTTELDDMAQDKDSH